MNELNRIENLNVKGLPGTGIAIKITPSLSESAFEKLREIFKSIIKIEEQSHSDDMFWEQNLPQWFVNKTKDVSKEELLNNNQLWHFGSWIDAVKQRGWKWWSKVELEGKTMIYLDTSTYPYNVDPFIYMLYTIGIEIDSIEISEIFPGSNNLKIV